MTNPKTHSGSRRRGRPPASRNSSRRHGRERPRVRREARAHPAARTPRSRRDSGTTRRARGLPSEGRLAAARFGGASRPLHILLVGWEFPPNHTGGLGVHCYELCQELTHLGHRVTFLTPFPGPFTPVKGVTFRHPGDRADRAPTDYPPAYWKGEAPGSPFADAIDGYNSWVGQFTPDGPVDVIHAHDWFGTVGANRLARRLSVPLVMTVHSTEYDRSLGHPWDHILRREQTGIDAGTRVIAVSRHLRQQLIDRYHAKPGRVRVIYNAVRPSDRLERIDPGKRIVLYVGRLAVMKGVDTFLRAAARVVPSFPDVLFVIAGEGPEYHRLIHLAAHLGIGDRVMFLGKVSEEEREVLLSGSSVFVLPSVVEPFGIAALEAMAAGVPTIVSKTSGVAEMSQGTTFRVDFWDVDEFASRISELLEYPTLREAMGDQGRWAALREGWPERARETLAVYLEAMAEKGVSP